MRPSSCLVILKKHTALELRGLLLRRAVCGCNAKYESVDRTPKQDKKYRTRPKLEKANTGKEDQTKEGERRKHKEVDEEVSQGVHIHKTQFFRHGHTESKTPLCIGTSSSSAIFSCSQPAVYRERSWTRGAPAARAAALRCLVPSRPPHTARSHVPVSARNSKIPAVQPRCQFVVLFTRDGNKPNNGLDIGGALIRGKCEIPKE